MSLFSADSFTLEELRAIRKKIADQVSKGVASFSYNGQSFTYSSPDQLMKVADQITREIRRRVAKDLGYIPVDPMAPIVRRPLSETQ